MPEADPPFASGNLFDTSQQVKFAEGAILLLGFAANIDQSLINAIDRTAIQAPFRHMATPGGFLMSVAITNCGEVGWVTDRKGYRYQATDPESGLPWPAIPEVFLDIATKAADTAGYSNFQPDACLINLYQAGARMGLHQDKDERDASAPIVSISLGLPAIFMFGGQQRSDKTQRMLLQHGDVVVWGGSSRFNYHGVGPIKAGSHPLLGQKRINLTFRKAL